MRNKGVPPENDAKRQKDPRLLQKDRHENDQSDDARLK